MTLNDPLATALSNIYNAEKIGRADCTIQVTSKIIKQVLDVFKAGDYIKGYETIGNPKKPIIKVLLNGNINRCAAIKPRFSVKLEEFEKFEKRFLPASNFGVLILTTSKGVITNQEAKEKKMGGRLLAYVY